VEKPQAPSTNTKTLNPPRSLPKNAMHLGQRIRISVVIGYWLETPEGASLFRPTYVGIGGGVVFGWQRRKALRFSGLHIWVSVVVWYLVGALYQPKNPLPTIKNVGWKSRRRLPPIPKRSIPPGACQKTQSISANVFVYPW